MSRAFKYVVGALLILLIALVGAVKAQAPTYTLSPLTVVEGGVLAEDSKACYAQGGRGAFVFTLDENGAGAFENAYCVVEVK